jgi:hypothetical protein
LKVVRELLRCCPEAVNIQCRQGNLPLHNACRVGASVHVLRELTKENFATVYQRTSCGKTPIDLLCEARENIETNLVQENLDSVSWHANQSKLKPVPNYSSVHWQKIQVLLEAVAVAKQREPLQKKCSSQHLYILHAAVAVVSEGCSFDVLLYALHKYPEQIKMCDERGRLPIHIAVSSTCSSETEPHRKLKSRKEQTIVRLLEIYPEAAGRFDPEEPEGRYPLHTALANQHEWYGGVRELVKNAPESLLELDSIEKVYPFQMAATGDLDATYQLLRRFPSALEDMRKAQENDSSPDIREKPRIDESTQQQPADSHKAMEGTLESWFSSLFQQTTLAVESTRGNQHRSFIGKVA